MSALPKTNYIKSIVTSECKMDMERKGIISDRCEINRQIREQNKLIRAIRDEITKLKNTIMTSVPALAKALETARKGILLLRYSWLYHTGAAKTLDARIQEIQPSYERFLEVRRFLREKSRQKKALTAELKALSPTSFLRRGDIKRGLAAVTEDMEELKSEQLGEPHPDEQRSVLHKLHRTQEQPAAEKQNRSHKNEKAVLIMSVTRPLIFWNSAKNTGLGVTAFAGQSSARNP